MKIIRLEKEHGYKTSRDYELLFKLAQLQSIICMVDYNESCRDISATLFFLEAYQVGARGISYIYEFSKDDFIVRCEQYNVEFIVPENGF